MQFLDSTVHWFSKLQRSGKSQRWFLPPCFHPFITFLYQPSVLTIIHHSCFGVTFNASVMLRWITLKQLVFIFKHDQTLFTISLLKFAFLYSFVCRYLSMYIFKIHLPAALWFIGLFPFFFSRVILDKCNEREMYSSLSPVESALCSPWPVIHGLIRSDWLPPTNAESIRLYLSNFCMNMKTETKNSWGKSKTH